MIIIKLQIKYKYKKRVGLDKFTLPSCTISDMKYLLVFFSLVGFSDFVVCLMLTNLVCFFFKLSYFVFYMSE